MLIKHISDNVDRVFSLIGDVKTQGGEFSDSMEELSEEASKLGAYFSDISEEVNMFKTED